MEQFFHIGTITSPHGIRGEVRVFPTTDDPARFLDLKSVILKRNESESGEVKKIQGVRFQKNMVLLLLEGINDRNAAETLRKIELYVAREDAVPLGENEWFIADLIGMDVYTEDGLLGKLTDVMQTGANDVYCVQSPVHGEVLIPAIKQCIMNVNVEGGRMDVHLLPGLIQERKK